MCLGGLFVPEAYITATRQYVAQANSWSLEELCLEVNVTTSQNATLDACSFGVTGEWGGPGSAQSEVPASTQHTHMQATPMVLRHDPAEVFEEVGRPGPRGAIPTSDGAVFLPGLKLQGATCNNNKLSLSNAISTVLPLTQLRWVKQTNAEKKASVVSGMCCPVRAARHRGRARVSPSAKQTVSPLPLLVGDLARLPELHPCRPHLHGGL